MNRYKRERAHKQIQKITTSLIKELRNARTDITKTLEEVQAVRGWLEKIRPEIHIES